MDRSQFFARYGVSTYLYTKRSLTEALEAIAGAGFHIVELWASETHLEPRLRPDIAATRALMGRLGLTVHSLHAPFYPELHIGDPDPAYRAGWWAAMEPAMHYAAELGAQGAVFHVSTIRGENTPERCAEGAKAVVEFVEDRLRPLAKQVGVHILFENMVNYGWPRFGCSMAELAERFPDPFDRFCIDVGHSHLDKVPPRDDVKAAGRRLLSIHGSNNDGQKDLHNSPTDGSIDWPDFLAALDEAGYRHPVILEVKGGDTPDSILAQLTELWRHLPG